MGSGESRIILHDDEMQRYLAGLSEKGIVAVLRKGVSSANAPLKRAVKAAVPVRRGGMRASVKARRIRTRGGTIGSVVGPMGKQAFMRHWVARGTKAHWIRPKGRGLLSTPFGPRRIVHHPGTRPNDYIGRALAASDAEAVARAERTIIREATK